MKNIKQFDVVELINGNKAIILKVDSTFNLAEIVNKDGEKIENRKIYNDEISKIIYSHE